MRSTPTSAFSLLLFTLSPHPLSLPPPRPTSLSFQSIKTTMFALKSSVVSRAAVVAPRRQVRTGRAGEASKGSICFFFQRADAVSLETVFAALCPRARAPARVQLSTSIDHADQCIAPRLRKRNEKASKGSYSCLAPFDQRPATLARSPKKKNSTTKLKASSRDVIAVRGVKVDAPINALDYGELTEVIR